MFDVGAPDHPNPAPAPGLDPGELPADAYWQLVHTLRLTLPPPPGEKPGPEDLARRDNAVIARIAALAPANAAEADLAAQFVAASEQWKECLRLAQQPETTPEWAMKCRAQANSMMRQANSALRLLLRVQQARRKLEADEVAADRLAWTEHCALGLMAEALSGTPLAACPPPAYAGAGPLPKGEEAGAPSPLPEGTEEAATSPLPLGEGQPWRMPGEGAADLIAAAERYAAAYPQRAASIRRTGRLPHDVCYFSPPEAALARALITARTPALAALDGPPAREANRLPGCAFAEAQAA